MKIILKLLLIALVAAALIYTVVSATTRDREPLVCSGVNITITDSLATGLIHESDVRDILNRHHMKIEGEPIDSIQNADIIDILSHSPYVDTATCFHTPTGRLSIGVVAMQPVLHVMAANGDEYYLDRKGKTMPVGTFNVDLNIATGHITRRYAAESLTPLAIYIQDDPFWQPLIQQINVTADRHVELVMRLGESVVDLGAPTRFKEKLGKLHLFLSQGLSEAGWNKYSRIDVGYKDIVVGTLVEGKEKGVAVLPVAPTQPRPDTLSADTMRHDTARSAPAAHEPQNTHGNITRNKVKSQ